jgi:hypothetical protein
MSSNNNKNQSGNGKGWNKNNSTSQGHGGGFGDPPSGPSGRNDQAADPPTPVRQAPLGYIGRGPSPAIPPTDEIDRMMRSNEQKKARREKLKEERVNLRAEREARQGKWAKAALKLAPSVPNLSMQDMPKPISSKSYSTTPHLLIFDRILLGPVASLSSVKFGDI